MMMSRMALSKREKAAEKRAERRAAAKAKEEAVCHHLLLHHHDPDPMLGVSLKICPRQIRITKPMLTECLKVSVMIRKYKMSEEEILKIWDEFYAKHPDGFMNKESFLATKEVIVITRNAD